MGRIVGQVGGRPRPGACARAPRAWVGGPPRRGSLRPPNGVVLTPSSPFTAFPGGRCLSVQLWTSNADRERHKRRGDDGQRRVGGAFTASLKKAANSADGSIGRSPTDAMRASEHTVSGQRREHRSLSMTPVCQARGSPGHQTGSQRRTHSSWSVPTRSWSGMTSWRGVAEIMLRKVPTRAGTMANRVGICDEFGRQSQGSREDYARVSLVRCARHPHGAASPCILSPRGQR
jgi:hypothetical protein